MFSSSSIRHLPFVRSYEEAQSLWDSRPEKTKSPWSAYQRPIAEGSSGWRKWHYRIEQGRGGQHYDVCLYHTVMARYHKPDGDKRVVEYTGHASPTSSSFMNNVLYIDKFNHRSTTDGRDVMVPVVPYHNLSTRLTLVAGKVDVEQSTHPQLYRMVPSGEDKEERKEFYKAIETWLNMMELRYENLVDETPARIFLKPTAKQGTETMLVPEWPEFVLGLARVAAAATASRESFRRVLSQKLVAHCLGATAKMRSPLPMFPSPGVSLRDVRAY